MGKDREPQGVNNIDQELQYQNRGLAWDSGISLAGVAAMALITSNLNLEPGNLRMVIMMVPPLVTAGGFVMAIHRGERMKYIEGKKDGILQETQKVATLTVNQPQTN